jgi:hypothetical protein
MLRISSATAICCPVVVAVGEMLTVPLKSEGSGFVDLGGAVTGVALVLATGSGTVAGAVCAAAVVLVATSVVEVAGLVVVS